MIDVDALVFEYPGFRALHGITVSIAPGSITALVGPNGAGKTTLLRCIAALDRPYSGHVKVAGFDVAEEPRKVHEVLGYLPDFFGLYDELTVARCLTYAARAHGVSADREEAAVKRAAARVGLTDRMQQTAGALSRGLRQRLAIGQAIVHEPKVLLLDEPAAGLDPEARRELSRLLIELKGQGITQLVSSHILAELEDYSTAMIVIDGGRIASRAEVRGGSAETVRVRIDIVSPPDGLGEILTRSGALEVIALDADSVVVLAPADPAARAALLAKLVGAGLAVANFTVVEQRLEDLYFEGIGTKETAR